MRAAAALIAAAALMAAASVAQAEPAGKTTLEETLTTTGAGPFRALVTAPG